MFRSNLNATAKLGIPVAIVSFIPLALILRLFRNWRKQRQILAKLTSKKKCISSSLNGFYARYPFVTTEQEGIVNLDFDALLAALSEGKLRAVEVLEAFQAKAVEVNKKTNAVVEFLEDAHERAAELDKLASENRGPLHGMPISLKV